MQNFQMGCMALKSSQTYRTYSPDGVCKVLLKKIAPLVPYQYFKVGWGVQSRIPSRDLLKYIVRILVCNIFLLLSRQPIYLHYSSRRTHHINDQRQRTNHDGAALTTLAFSGHAATYPPPISYSLAPIAVLRLL